MCIFKIHDFYVLMMLFSLISQYDFARSDMVFRYYEDTDDFALYFVRATPGVIYYCDNATYDVLVSYTHDDKIVSIDIERVSRAL